MRGKGNKASCPRYIGLVPSRGQFVRCLCELEAAAWGGFCTARPQASAVRLQAEQSEEKLPKIDTSLHDDLTWRPTMTTMGIGVRSEQSDRISYFGALPS